MPQRQPFTKVTLTPVIYNTTQYSPTGIKITQLPLKGELKIGTI